MTISALILSLSLAVSLQDVGVERRGALLTIVYDQASETPYHCAQACAGARECQAWTWRAQRPNRPARCELLSTPGRQSPAPDAVSDLAPQTRAEIDAIMNRRPSLQEDQQIDEILADRH